LRFRSRVVSLFLRCSFGSFVGLLPVVGSRCTRLHVRCGSFVTFAFTFVAFTFVRYVWFFRSGWLVPLRLRCVWFTLRSFVYVCGYRLRFTLFWFVYVVRWFVWFFRLRLVLCSAGFGLFFTFVWFTVVPLLVPQFVVVYVAVRLFCSSFGSLRFVSFVGSFTGFAVLVRCWFWFFVRYSCRLLRLRLRFVVYVRSVPHVVVAFTFRYRLVVPRLDLRCRTVTVRSFTFVGLRSYV